MYLQTQELNNWLVLCGRRDTDLARQFVRMLMQMAGQKGLPLAEPEIVPFSCAEVNYHYLFPSLKKH